MSPDPFLGAADLFETEWSLDDPVHVKVRDPDERTWAGHYDGYHVLNVSKRAATSAMARELAVHELSHMARYEEGARVSHPIDRGGAVPRALRRDGGAPQARALLPDREPHEGHLRRRHHALGRARGQAPRLPRVDPRGRRRRPTPSLPGRRPPVTAGADPEITAVNAAFALALVERHDIAGPGHRITTSRARRATPTPSTRRSDAVARRRRDFGRSGSSRSARPVRERLPDRLAQYASRAAARAYAV